MADADIEPKPVDQKTLVADIDRTRAELARTIDAISDRVNPTKNVQRAADQLRERADQLNNNLRERADQINNNLREREPTRSTSTRSWSAPRRPRSSSA